MNTTGSGLKISMFVWINSDQLIHELHGKTYPITNEISSILKDVENRSPTTYQLLYEDSGNARKAWVEFLLREGILVSVTKDETGLFYPQMIDIETVRHCNARCVFCPQSVDSKPLTVMTPRVFKKILARIERFQPAWVTLTHYGEPLLDPYFKKRVSELSDRNMSLLFASNGILLTQHLIDFLSGVKLHSMHFNFPSLVPRQWSMMMHIPEEQFSKAKNAIESVLREYSDRVDVNIVVNSVIADRLQRAREIENHFCRFGRVNVMLADTRSRCGTIRNKHVSMCEHVEERFGGCERIVHHLYISWEGKSFLCSDDYYQTVILGDLLKDDVMSIMTAEPAKRLRAEIYGLSTMRKDLICRHCVKLRKHRRISDTFVQSSSTTYLAAACQHSWDKAY